MQLTVLGASGAIGRQIVHQALQRGHTVTAASRHPGGLPDHANLRRVVADVRDPGSIDAALDGATVILSGLGTSKGDKPGVLTAGAHAAARAHPERIVWLGTYGTGRSAPASGALTRTLLKVGMRSELADKIAADTAILEVAGTVFHAGPFSGGPISPTRRVATLADAPKRIFPATVSRATVAAAMLDEAENPRHPGQVILPLDR
jgi:uncharacterized protein